MCKSTFVKGSLKGKQLDLSVYKLSQIKSFTKALFNADLKDSLKWFDKLDCSISWARESDKKMDLKTYLEHLKEETFLVTRLQFGSPHPTQIRFVIRSDIFQNKVERFIWVECPLTEENYQKVENLFIKSFGHIANKVVLN